MKMYGRFAGMIATSTAVRFGLMYLNTCQLDHATLSGKPLIAELKGTA